MNDTNPDTNPDGSPDTSTPKPTATQQAASPSSPLNLASDDDPKHRLTPGRLRERVVLLAEHTFQFALDAAGQLYIYDDGRYHADGEERLRHWIMEQLRRSGNMMFWTQRWERDTIAALSRCKPRLWERPPDMRICLLNGVLDIPTLTLEPHAPTWFSSVQIPITYDTTARDDAWPTFLADVFPADALDYAWEVIGGCLTPWRGVQEGAWLSGTGANGKSTFGQALMHLVGRDNVSSVSIAELDSDRFAAAELYGKLLNIDLDAETTSWRSTSVFKKSVVGDLIRAQHKNARAFTFTPHCKMVIASNSLPRAADTTEGFMRRWTIVPFTRNFDMLARRRSQDSLITELTTPRALSAALNLALAGLYRLTTNHQHTAAASLTEARSEYRQSTDPLFQFAAHVVVTVNTLLQAIPDPVQRAQLATAGVFMPTERLEELYMEWSLGQPDAKVLTRQHLHAWFQRNKPEQFKSHRQTTGDGEQRGFLVRVDKGVQ